MNTIDVMKQALEALESCIHDPRMRHTDSVHYEVVDAGRMLSKAITELESAEPVAWMADSGTCVTENRNPTYYNIPLFTHPAQSRDSIIEECAAVCEEVHSRYPTDIFPEGQSVTAQSAKMARITANNCASEIRALKGRK